MHDLEDIRASWDAAPPVSIALRRLEDVLLAGFRLARRDAPEKVPDGPPSTPDELDAFMRVVNARG